MTEPEPAAPREAAPPVDPTLRVARPPVPGRAVRADVAARHLATPPVHHDEPTVALDPSAGRPPHRTQEFGTPAAVNVSVGPRPRRRYRSWPWIVGLALVLLVLGLVLLVMMLRGATIDGTADLVGVGTQPAVQGWAIGVTSSR
jgi:hypothetical protein